MAIYQNPLRIRLGLSLVAIGLVGHLLAAGAMGGTARAYFHHVLGFVLILVVSGAIVVALERRFWNRRFDITLLVIGAIQAAAGIAIYILEAAA